MNKPRIGLNEAIYFWLHAIENERDFMASNWFIIAKRMYERELFEV